MNVNKFRIVRLIIANSACLAYFIFILVGIVTVRHNIDFGTVMLLIVDNGAYFLICGIAHFMLNLLFPSGVAHNKKAVVYLVDTLLYLMLCILLYFIFLLLTYAVFCLSIALGGLPAPS